MHKTFVPPKLCRVNKPCYINESSILNHPTDQTMMESTLAFAAPIETIESLCEFNWSSAKLASLKFGTFVKPRSRCGKK